MKKSIYFLLLICGLLCFSCGKKTVVKGVIEGADSSKLVIENFNAGKPIVLADKVLGSKGEFSFKVPALDTTEIYNLVLDDRNIIRLVVKPEDKIRIETTKAKFGIDYKVEGSEESQLFAEAEKKLYEVRQQLANIKKEYSEAANAEAKEKLAEEYQTIFASHHDYLRRFVFNNASSLIAYLALYQKVDADSYVFQDLDDDKYVRAVAQKIKMEHPNSPYLGLLIEELKRRDEQRLQVRLTEILQQAKDSYPDLKLNDIENKEIILSKTQAKYVLIYFGTLNDVAKETLMPIYNKYHNKGFQIYFVDENPNIGIWKQAVKDLQTPWINVHDTNRIAAATYNVQNIPSNYIIKVDGTIEGKDLFGRYLLEKLDKLF